MAKELITDKSRRIAQDDWVSSAILDQTVSSEPKIAPSMFRVIRDCASRQDSNTLNPLVSIIIPAYNAAAYIQEAIESVLNQTLRDYEIVVVDDGSKDETYEALQPYLPCIQYIYQNNQGASAARNRGIQESRGKYISFLDADDFFILSTKLAEQADYLNQHDEIGIIHSGWRKVDENSNPIVDVEPWHRSPELDVETWIVRNPVLPSAMMFRREWLERAHGFDCRFPSAAEDVDLTNRLALMGCRSAWLPKVTVGYRQHGNSSTKQIWRQANSLYAVITHLFNIPDLPDKVTQLEKKAKYHTLVWSAGCFCAAGNLNGMTAYLLESLQYTSRPRTETMTAWLNAFISFFPDQFGFEFDVYSVTTSPAWKRLMTYISEATPTEKLPKLDLTSVMPVSSCASYQECISGQVVNSQRNKLLNKIEKDSKLEEDFEELTFVTETKSCIHAKENPSQLGRVRDYPIKLNLRSIINKSFGTHRSGWPYAISLLRELHKDNGVLLEGYIEKKFCWGYDAGDCTNNLRPHTEPWVGFIHNPPNIPSWFQYQQSPQAIFSTPLWQESLKYCKGLFCLSNYLKQWLDTQLDLPVESVIHPTEIPNVQFSMERFLANPNRGIVQVGFWLRRLNSIYCMPPLTIKKYLLWLNKPYVNELFDRERQIYGIRPNYASVELVKYLANDEYDQFLAQNIVYLDLYDSSANNAVIECIVRNTPLLINPLPAVKEYLGDDYPFYFKTREEAAQKAEDMDMIRDTHEYLKAHPIKQKMTPEAFIEAIATSEIYQSLKLAP